MIYNSDMQCADSVLGIQNYIMLLSYFDQLYESSNNKILDILKVRGIDVVYCKNLYLYHILC